ncbi:MAG: hypothetical protein WDO56_22775 [Gammaproteobacteria bacterium]
MSIGGPPTPARFARQGVPGEKTSELFDLIAAAAAMQAGQVAHMKVPSGPELDFRTPDASVERRAPVFTLMAPHTQVMAGPQVETAAAAIDEPACLTIRTDEPEIMPRIPVKLDETAYTVAHGTLPVFIAGQLVELTLLRERRPTRDTEPTRRLSMVLEAASPGSVKIDAQVEGDCLVIALDGAESADAEAPEGYAREVEALARRLGWKFTGVRWENAR